MQFLKKSEIIMDKQYKTAYKLILIGLACFLIMLLTIHVGDMLGLSEWMDWIRLIGVLPAIGGVLYLIYCIFVDLSSDEN